MSEYHIRSENMGDKAMPSARTQGWSGQCFAQPIILS